MRAGTLDRTITLLASTAGEPDEYGTVTEGWAEAGRFHAAVVTQSTEEFLRGSGEANETVIVFRTRWIPTLTNANRIRFEGRDYDVKERKEIGRRVGLELRCEETRP